MERGPVRWSISVPGMAPGSAVMVELDTKLSIARIAIMHPDLATGGDARADVGVVVVPIAHEQLCSLVRVMMGWPVMHGAVTSISESAS